MPDHPDIPRIRVARLVGAIPLKTSAFDVAVELKRIDTAYPGAKITGVEFFETDEQGRIVDLLEKQPDYDGVDFDHWDSVECLEVEADILETDKQYERRVRRLVQERRREALRQQQIARKLAQSAQRAARRAARRAAEKEEKERQELLRLIHKHGVPNNI
jgi:hypothetical protein